MAKASSKRARARHMVVRHLDLKKKTDPTITRQLNSCSQVSEHRRGPSKGVIEGCMAKSYAYIYTCMFHIYICIYIYMYIRVFHIYVYVYVHIYIYTCRGDVEVTWP